MEVVKHTPSITDFVIPEQQKSIVHKGSPKENGCQALIEFIENLER